MPDQTSGRTKRLVADCAIVSVDQIVAVPEHADAGVFLTLWVSKLTAARSSGPETDQAREQTFVMSEAVLMDLLSVLNAARQNLGIAEQAAAPGVIVPPEAEKH